MVDDTQLMAMSINAKIAGNLEVQDKLLEMELKISAICSSISPQPRITCTHVLPVPQEMLQF